MMQEKPASLPVITQPVLINAFEQTVRQWWSLHRDTATKSQQQAYESFLTLRFPSSKQEAWKYFDLKALGQKTFQLALPKPALKALPSAYVLPEVDRIVFVDGMFQPELSSYQQPEVTQDGACSRIIITQDYFETLTRILNPAPVSIRIDQASERPLHFILLNSDASADCVETRFAAPLMELTLGAHAKRTVLIDYVSLNPVESLESGFRDIHCPVLDIILEPYADLEMMIRNEQNASVSHFSTVNIHAGAHSQARLLKAAFSQGLVRNLMTAQFEGEAATVEMNAMSVLHGQSFTSNQTIVNHNLPNCQSSQLFKGLVDGKARLEFNGTVMVQKGAQYTDAQQLNKNLLLSPQARVYTRPQLRIDADDVKCAHGATIGQLNAEELFYLQSRGFSQTLAKTMLIHGFVQDAAHSLNSAFLQEAVKEGLHTALCPLSLGQLIAQTKPETVS
jgi:Fe-S cluster assembly protein SufD